MKASVDKSAAISAAAAAWREAKVETENAERSLTFAKENKAEKERRLFEAIYPFAPDAYVPVAPGRLGKRIVHGRVGMEWGCSEDADGKAQWWVSLNLFEWVMGQAHRVVRGGGWANATAILTQSVYETLSPEVRAQTPESLAAASNPPVDLTLPIRFNRMLEQTVALVASKADSLDAVWSYTGSFPKPWYMPNAQVDARQLCRLLTAGVIVRAPQKAPCEHVAMELFSPGPRWAEALRVCSASRNQIVLAVLDADPEKSTTSAARPASPKPR